MKSFLTFAASLLLLTAPYQAHADNVIILKSTETTSGQYYNEDNPVNDAFGNNPAGATAPSGYAVDSFTHTNNSYLIINLTTSEVTVVYYYSYSGYPGVPATKVMYFDGPYSLSNYFDSFVPLKTAKTYLWNYQYGSENELTSPAPVEGDPDIRGQDTDGNDVIDYLATTFRSAHIKGVGAPLVVSTTLTIQNVPTSITGKRNETRVEDWDTVTYGEDTYVPYRSFEKSLTTVTLALDVATTKAANLTALAGTADLGFSGSIAPASTNNAKQRVRNLLYALGYRIPAGAP